MDEKGLIEVSLEARLSEEAFRKMDILSEY